MSEVKRYGVMGTATEVTEETLRLYPGKTVYVAGSDYDALEQRCQAAERRVAELVKALESVTDGGFDPDSGSGNWGVIRVTFEDWNALVAALKPTEEAESE